LRTYRDVLGLGVSRERLRQKLAARKVAAISRGIYGPSVNYEIDRIQAVLMRLPDEALLARRSAAALYGFTAARDGLIHIQFPSGMAKPRIKGVMAHEAVVPVERHVEMFGVRCVPPARTAIDLARAYRRRDALATLDSALRSRQCTADDLAQEVLLHDGLRGVRHVRELVPLADAGAACAQESHLRLAIIDGRLPVPKTQVWARTAKGNDLYRIDMAYEDDMIGVEYDGASHLTRDRLRADRRRMNWLTANGWTMCYFTAADLYKTPTIVVHTVANALRSARHR
jgi:very-short-patch-repair endonuclease